MSKIINGYICDDNGHPIYRFGDGNISLFDTTYVNPNSSYSKITGKTTIPVGLSAGNNASSSKGMSGLQLGAMIGGSVADDWTAALSGSKPRYSSSASSNGFGFVDNTLAGGNKSKVGTGMVNAGASAFNIGMLTGNPWVMLGGGIAATLGTGINTIWGSNVNEENVNNYRTQIANVANQTSGASTSNEFLRDFNRRSTIQGVGKDYFGTDGWKSHTVKDLKSNLLSSAAAGTKTLIGNYNMRGDTINLNNTNNQVKELSAFGGPIGGAIDYQMANDYMNNYNNRTNSRSNNNMLYSPFTTGLFAEGGEMYGTINSNGASFGDGMLHFNVGDTHELNPNEGILVGIDLNGTPNLVEEGEVVYDDYVYSNRLKVPKLKLKRKEKPTLSFKVLRKYEGKTYADAAKKAEKDSGVDERPNDKICKDTFESILNILLESLERERAKQQLKELLDAINNMTPEEFALYQLLMQLELALEQLLQLVSPEELLAMMLLLGMPLGQPSPELILQMLLLGMPLLMPPLGMPMQPLMANGGLFAEGGDISLLNNSLELESTDTQVTDMPLTEEASQDELSQFNYNTPAEEMSTSELNLTIDAIYQYAKEHKDKELIKKARLAKRGSRDAKEEFVDDAREDIEMEISELKEQLQKQLEAADVEAQLQLAQAELEAAMLGVQADAGAELDALDNAQPQMFALGGQMSAEELALLLDLFMESIGLILNDLALQYYKQYIALRNSNDANQLAQALQLAALLYQALLQALAQQLQLMPLYETQEDASLYIQDDNTYANGGSMDLNNPNAGNTNNDGLKVFSGKLNDDTSVVRHNFSSETNAAVRKLLSTPTEENLNITKEEVKITEEDINKVTKILNRYLKQRGLTLSDADFLQLLNELLQAYVSNKDKYNKEDLSKNISKDLTDTITSRVSLYSPSTRKTNLITYDRTNRGWKLVTPNAKNKMDINVLGYTVNPYLLAKDEKGNWYYSNDKGKTRNSLSLLSPVDNAKLRLDAGVYNYYNLTKDTPFSKRYNWDKFNETIKNTDYAAPLWDKNALPSTKGTEAYNKALALEKNKNYIDFWDNVRDAYRNGSEEDKKAVLSILALLGLATGKDYSNITADKLDELVLKNAFDASAAKKDNSYSDKKGYLGYWHTFADDFINGYGNNGATGYTTWLKNADGTYTLVDGSNYTLKEGAKPFDTIDSDGIKIDRYEVDPITNSRNYYYDPTTKLVWDMGNDIDGKAMRLNPYADDESPLGTSTTTNWYTGESTGSDLLSDYPKAPVWPYLTGIGLQAGALGYNLFHTPDYSNAEAMINLAREAGLYTPVKFKPIGEYIKEHQYDINYVNNIANANNLAALRGIYNSSNGNTGIRLNNALALNYNYQLGVGNNYKQLFDYNAKDRLQAATFNRLTDLYNSEADLKALMANLEAKMKASLLGLEGAAKGYAMKLAIDDARSNAISAGISGLANGLYNWAALKYYNDLMAYIGPKIGKAGSGFTAEDIYKARLAHLNGKVANGGPIGKRLRRTIGIDALI